MNKIVVLFSYYEKNDIYKKNLEFFLKLGVYDECDYVFIISGTSTVNIPEKSNIKVLYRDNIDYDFGAYTDGLKIIDINKYDYFTFINSSVRGPFIPSFVNIKWYQPFINLLKDNVKLVGTTINILNTESSSELQLFRKLTNFEKPYTHVQSQMFVVDRDCLTYLINNNFFTNYTYQNYSEFIAITEILMSQLVLKNGWNISCVVPEYQNQDYKLLKEDINKTSINGDPNFTGACFGRTIHPYECIFIKINRNLCFNEIDSLSKYWFSSIS